MTISASAGTSASTVSQGTSSMGRPASAPATPSFSCVCGIFACEARSTYGPGAQHHRHAEPLVAVFGLERRAAHAPLGRHVHAEPARPLELHALQADAEDARLGIAPEHDAGGEVAAGVQLGVHDDRQRRAVGRVAL